MRMTTNDPSFAIMPQMMKNMVAKLSRMRRYSNIWRLGREEESSKDWIAELVNSTTGANGAGSKFLLARPT